MQALRTISVHPDGKGLIVVDWGSNNLRAEHMTRVDSSAPVLRRTVAKERLELQKDISALGYIGEERRAALCRFFHEVFFWAVRKHIREVVIVGTSAVREDARREQTVAAVAETIAGTLLQKHRAGDITREINIVDGDTESDLAALAVLWSVRDPYQNPETRRQKSEWDIGARFINTSVHGLVCDLGGGSLELTYVDHGVIARRFSLPFGALRLKQDFYTYEAAYDHVMGELQTLAQGLPEVAALYCSGGGFRNLFRMAGRAVGDPFGHAHNFIAPHAGPIRDFLSEISEESDKVLTALDCHPERQPSLPQACLVAETLLDALQPDRVVCCSHSIRKGVVHALHLQQEDADAQAFRDPLMVQCRRLLKKKKRRKRDWEEAFAALPAVSDPMQRRLQTAFAMLCHLDLDQATELRAEAAFARVMERFRKKNDMLGPLAPDERLQLALAMAYRYQASLPPVAEKVLADVRKSRRRLGFTDVNADIARLHAEAKRWGEVIRKA